MSEALREQLVGSLRDADAHGLHKQIRAAEVLKAGRVQITDDADAIRDTIEGSTNLHECIRAVLLSIENDQAMVDGLTARIDELVSRRDRFKDRVRSKRTLIEQAMSVGELQSVERAMANGSSGTRTSAASPPGPMTVEACTVESYCS